MKAVFQLLKEQYDNKHLIFRLAAFEQRSKFQLHYLGALWQLFSPLMQVVVFFVIFGLGIRQGKDVGDTPFFVWLLCGLIPWFFISPTVLQASNSIHKKINMVSKMKFPVSVLPSIVIVGNSISFFVMLGVLGIVLVIYSVFSGAYLLQLPYYLLCLYAFLYVFTLFSATIATVIRDYYNFLQAGMRMLFFLSPIVWVPASMPEKLLAILQMNPFYYIMTGFRDTFIGGRWFYEDLTYMAFFWSGILLIGFIGSHVFYKFKNSFVDYL
ncbi:ABC transporter permease [Shouchella clausii]|uniref:Transport permease protein n=2 Tax=Shouchella TaxID=2893057 RepID=Q5WCL1_SHOC1|nr:MULTISPECIES: ABC transporter permease [Shouchella]MCM3312899.1 ABC transporter permease [Psychrobacillus sp. MER TA 17]ALA53740.1 Teichoic acid translocation permease protein TagG [Shouchella clausii]KKI87422.1 Teichoic acid translocation permease TagG [Shouchella clausii]MBU3229694.1 ABC transporter permease [Shouchella clausii]MBU3264222.1 ABC transporter permease [Shouchella clausii]